MATLAVYQFHGIDRESLSLLRLLHQGERMLAHQGCGWGFSFNQIQDIQPGQRQKHLALVFGHHGGNGRRPQATAFPSGPTASADVQFMTAKESSLVRCINRYHGAAVVGSCGHQRIQMGVASGRDNLDSTLELCGVAQAAQCSR